MLVNVTVVGYIPTIVTSIGFSAMCSVLKNPWTEPPQSTMLLWMPWRTSHRTGLLGPLESLETSIQEDVYGSKLSTPRIGWLDV